MTSLQYICTHIEAWLPQTSEIWKSSEAPKLNQAALQLKAIMPLEFAQKPNQARQLYLHNKIKSHYFIHCS